MKTHTRHLLIIIALTIAIITPTAVTAGSEINWEINAGPVYINGTTATYDPGCYYCIHHHHHNYHKHIKKHHHKKHHHPKKKKHNPNHNRHKTKKHNPNRRH